MQRQHEEDLCGLRGLFYRREVSASLKESLIVPQQQLIESMARIRDKSLSHALPWRVASTYEIGQLL